ncbi:MAG: flagellar basal body P-ring formation chaperone FlgA [Phycisphaerae bacterium]
MSTLLRLALTSVALAGSAAADLIERDVSHLKLRPQAHVYGDVIALSDVLVFAQADPRLLTEIGDKPVAGGLVPPAETEISHEQVVRRLKELGVNLGRVLVSGALACQVTLEPAEANAPRTDLAEDAPLMRARPLPEGETTLADMLRAHVEDGLASMGGTVEIEFERAGLEFLELTTPPFQFSIRGNRGPKLGLREFRITIRRDGRAQRTVRIGARVKLVKKLLVAARPLNVGMYVKHDSLEYATRIFSSERELGIDHPERVIGQRVKNFVPAGQMVRESDLKSVDLVKRSQPVTVVGGENVSIRISGDALDSGGYGDTVRVRLGDSGKNRREVRGVVIGVGRVRLTDGGL